MFKRSFKQAIKGKVWKFLLGGLGTITTIFLFGKNLFDMETKNSIFYGCVAILAIFLIRYLYFLCMNTVIFIHNTYVDSIWGEAIVDLKDAYSEIHYLRKNENFSDLEFMNTMIVFCDTLKKIFDRKTKANCCVSIKVPIVESDNLETIVLRNLCRDTYHKGRDTEQYMAVKHTIIGNTPYRVIVNKILKKSHKNLAYVNNDIENTRDYDNTSKECNDKGILPYKSELVFPIIPIKDDDTKNSKMCGFICIDCNEKGKFDETRYDVPMVEGIADGIYDVIIKRNQKHNQE